MAMRPYSAKGPASPVGRIIWDGAYFLKGVR